MDRGQISYERFLDGNDSGMEEIITEYNEGLIFYLYKLVGSLSLAEELAEDTFVLLCTKKPKNRQKSSFKTWLYTIGRNLAIDHLRRAARRKTLSLDSCPELGNDNDNPENEYLRDEEKITVNRVMKQLKPEYRQILHLMYFEGLSHKDISIIMQKSVHATQMLASRAKQALKTELIKEGINYENYR